MTEASADLGERGELLRVARGGGINLIGTAFNQALRFGITLLLARLLDRGDVGRYFQATAFLTLLGLLALSGFRGALTRFVAVHRADGDEGTLRGTLRVGLILPTASAAVFGAALYALTPTIAHDMLHDAGMMMPLRLVAVALPATAFTDAALSATQGYRTMAPFVLVNMIFEPAFRVVVTVVLLALGWGLHGAMVGLVATNCAAAVFAALALRRLTGPLHSPAKYASRELFVFSVVSWLASLAGTGLVWADTIILGIYRPERLVGLYGVATRLTLLETLALAAVTTAFAPQIADLYRRGNLDRLKRLFAVVTSWTLRLSIPQFVVLVVFARPLLHVFGRAFLGGATVTIVLAIGQMFDVATGPTGYMLVMSGRPKLTMINNLFALALNIGLNLYLIPRHGILGAAVAWTISLALINIAKLVQVWVTMHMQPFDVGFVKGCIAGVIAFIPALIVRALLHGFVSLVVGSAATIAVYVIALLALKLGDEDRLVLRELGARAKLVPARAQ